MSHCKAYPWFPTPPTAVLVLADGSVLEGFGVGATGTAVGEVCFNTSMTGYQEILTDSSYTDQIITFTFPHIGNTGANKDDCETAVKQTHSGPRGAIFHAQVSNPSNHRSCSHFNDWMASSGIIGLTGIDTRALTTKIRNEGALNALIAHHPDGIFDLDHLRARSKQWTGLNGLDLAAGITCPGRIDWKREHFSSPPPPLPPEPYRVVVLDFGTKTNIIRHLFAIGCQPILMPATSSWKDIEACHADAYLLSNGPGDPAATASYALPLIHGIIKSGRPVFGICLGHQLLGLALGAMTIKMTQGHHGSNHPVKDLDTGKVDVTAMNHGFTLDRASLPSHVKETHISLFDGTNCGLSVRGAPIFSVQHHPEASPGSHDAHYLFIRFLNMIRAQRQLPPLSESSSR